MKSTIIAPDYAPRRKSVEPIALDHARRAAALLVPIRPYVAKDVEA